MKPDWDSLGEKYENSKKVVIGDVDCTTESGKPLCERFGVSGYPTLKYFNPPNTEGETYEGERTLKGLTKFVKTLGPSCTPATWGKCSKKQKAELQPYIDLGKEALEEMVRVAKAELDSSQTAHEALSQSFQEQFEASEKSLKALKETHEPTLKLAKAALVPVPVAEDPVPVPEPVPQPAPATACNDKLGAETCKGMAHLCSDANIAENCAWTCTRCGAKDEI